MIKADVALNSFYCRSYLMGRRIFRMMGLIWIGCCFASLIAALLYENRISELQQQNIELEKKLDECQKKG
jgi:hypothetical protein